MINLLDLSDFRARLTITPIRSFRTSNSVNPYKLIVRAAEAMGIRSVHFQNREQGIKDIKALLKTL